MDRGFGGNEVVPLPDASIKPPSTHSPVEELKSTPNLVRHHDDLCILGISANVTPKFFGFRWRKKTVSFFFFLLDLTFFSGIGYFLVVFGIFPDRPFVNLFEYWVFFRVSGIFWGDGYFFRESGVFPDRSIGNLFEY